MANNSNFDDKTGQLAQDGLHGAASLNRPHIIENGLQGAKMVKPPSAPLPKLPPPSSDTKK